MSSIIEGYNYDIFISYRQKDNKGDRWVSEFVEALKTELESTFKEEISVYLDINPHDGLLETHDVDESLKEKLKCLVFIPIISRTYCDPKSFAWEHEFKAFIKDASHDQFGLKIKLPNGNVASRVLPVRIHDLDNEDIKLCESVLVGVLRGIEFIYKEPGVNRPLTLRDNEEKNSNKTNYRNQINKVANAIREIIPRLKAEPVGSNSEKIQLKVAEKEINRETSIEEHEKPVKSVRIKILSGLLITAVLVIAAIFAYPKIFRHDKLENLRSSDGRISVAVMPFQNMTNDTIWNVWQEGIQNELINYLTNFNEDLKVRQTESVSTLIQSKGLTNYASITPGVASSISQKLDANVLIYGSIKQAGSIIRVNAQLIDSKTEEIIKSFQVEGLFKEENIFHIIDSIAIMIKNNLIISKLENELGKETTNDIFLQRSTNSPEAFRYYIYGNNALFEKDLTAARNWYLRVISIDSNFFSASSWLTFIYCNQGNWEQAKKLVLKLYKKRDQMPMQQQLMINQGYSYMFETPNECIKWLLQILNIDDQQPITLITLGLRYLDLKLYYEAIPNFEKALEIYKKWDSKPLNVWLYTFLGFSYHRTNQYKKEKELYKKAEQDFPDDFELNFWQAILSLSERDTLSAGRYIEKIKSLANKASASQADIATCLADIYSEAGILEKAEQCYRQALSSVELTSDNSRYFNNLAWFLIDKDRNIKEGIELIKRALKLSPEDYSYLDIKGWGLYKQGKYKESLDILQKSWNLRMKNAIYDHSAFLHLEAAKKAFSNQKNN